MIKPADRTERNDDANEFQDVSFGRTVGQIGVDVRYPFIKSSGGVDWIIEPRAQVTQSFGDGRLENFSSSDSNGENTISTFQDGVNVDLDQALFWQSNKATAHLFLGQSYIKNREGDFALGSGLSEGKSDLVGLFELDINNKFSWTTRLRYDDDSDKFRRIDTGFSYRGERLSTGWRYYRIDSATNDAERANLVDTRLLDFDPLAPPEEVSGNVRLKLTDKWSLRYAANRDVSR